MSGNLEEFVTSSLNLRYSVKLKASRARVEEQNDKYCVMDKLRNETQQLMDKSEQLAHYVTHLCYQKYTSVFRPRFIKEDGLPSPYCSPKVNYDKDDSNVKNNCSDHCRRNKSVSSDRNIDSESYLRSDMFTSMCNCPKRKPLQEVDKHIGAGPPPSATPKSPTLSRRRSFNSSFITLFILLVAGFARVSECCSSRSTPKPRPSSPTLRPNVTFQTYACPPAYAAWYCLNGATCFTVKIQDAILYNCECAEGYMGPRCEFKDLDGSYLPAKDRVLLETASIAGGACIAIILVFFVLFSAYIFVHKDRGKRSHYDNPYHDKKPLGDSEVPEFVCTIVPAKVTPVHQHSTEVPSTTQEVDAGLFYIISGSSGVSSSCTCQRRDLSGHVICLKHSKRFLLPTNVPSYV